jgi:hypothetical protein
MPQRRNLKEISKSIIGCSLAAPNPQGSEKNCHMRICILNFNFRNGIRPIRYINYISRDEKVKLSIVEDRIVFFISYSYNLNIFFVICVSLLWRQ